MTDGSGTRAGPQGPAEGHRRFLVDAAADRGEVAEGDGDIAQISAPRHNEPLASPIRAQLFPENTTGTGFGNDGGTERPSIDVGQNIAIHVDLDRGLPCELQLARGVAEEALPKDRSIRSELDHDRLSRGQAGEIAHIPGYACRSVNRSYSGAAVLGFKDPCRDGGALGEARKGEKNKQGDGKDAGMGHNSEGIWEQSYYPRRNLSWFQEISWRFRRLPELAPPGLFRHVTRQLFP